MVFFLSASNLPFSLFFADLPYILDESFAVDDPLGNRHVCHKCFKQYKSRGSLTSHLRFECGIEKQFQCDYCQFRCKLKQNLTKHVKNRHQRPMNATKSFSCPHCSKSYFHKHHLNSHLRKDCRGSKYQSSKYPIPFHRNQHLIEFNY